VNKLINTIGEKVLSVVLLGSTAMGEIKQVQDVDVYVVLDEDWLDLDTLEKIKHVLNFIHDEFTDDETFIAISSKEGPFKIGPIKRYNIGLHIIFFTKLQIKRLCLQESTLGKAMLTHCKVLHGVHPFEIGGRTDVSLYDILNNAFTIAHLKALLLNSVLQYDIEKNPYALFGIIEYSVLSAVINALMLKGYVCRSREEGVHQFSRHFATFEERNFPLQVYLDKFRIHYVVREKSTLIRYIDQAIRFLSKLIRYMEELEIENREVIN